MEEGAAMPPSFQSSILPTTSAANVPSSPSVEKSLMPGIAVILAIAVCAPGFGQTFLVKDGKSGAEIVVAAKPTRTAKLAST